MLDRTRRCVSTCLLILLAGVAPVAQEDGRASELPFRVAGGVLDPDGRPVAGARVWVRVADQSLRSKPTEDDWVDPFFVVTDEDGRFAASLAVDGPYRLLARHDGWPPFQPHDAVDAGASVAMAFPSPLKHAGRVVDEAAKPVAGADVFACLTAAGAREFGAAACIETRADKTGAFSFERLGRGGYTIQAVAPGKTWSDSVNVKLTAGEGTAAPAATTLTLAPGAEVSGTVRDDAGTPLAGVHVYHATERVRLNQARRARDLECFVRVISDDEGAFTLRGLPANQPLKLFARVADRRPAESATITLEPGGAVSGVAVVYRRPAAAVVRLVDPDEQPVDALDVLWKPVKEGQESPAGLFRMRGFSGIGKVDALGDGRFRLHGVEPGRYDVTLLPEGFDEIVFESTRLRPGEELDFGTHVVRAGIRLKGWVVDDLGEPVAGATIEGTYLKDGAALARSVKSRDDGSFTLGGLAPGPLMRLSADAEGHARHVEQRVPSDRSDHEIVLERSGAVTGSARLEDGSVPRELEATLEETAGQSLGFGRARSPSGRGDDEGRFEIADAAPGTYSLRLKARGTRPLRIKDVVVSAGEATDVGSRRLELGRVLSGTVLDLADDTPIAAAAVRVEPVGGPVFGDRPALGAAPTDVDGRFEVGGLEEGSLLVVVEHAEYATSQKRIVLRADEPVEELAFRLGRGGLLRGTVRGESGAPAKDRVVGASPGGAGIATANLVRTDDAGRYRIERLSPGSYRVMLYPDPSAGGLDMRQKTASIREGEETVVDFDAGTRIAFEGFLTRGGRVVGDVTVMLLPQGETGVLQMKTATVDLAGRFETGLDGPGAYNVIVQDLREGLGRMVGQARIVVPDEPSVSLEIALESGSISGRVTDRDGQPVEDAVIGATLEGASMGEFGTGGGARVESDGRYRIVGVGDGTYTVSATAEGYRVVTRRVSVRGSSETAEVDFVLEPAGALHGRVVDAGGNGIVRAFVFVRPSGAPGQGVAIPTETDAEGYFRLSAPVDGPCDVEAVAAGFAPGVVAGYRPSGDPGDPGVVITLGQGGRLAIRVVDGEGYPVEGAQPYLVPDVPSDALRIAMMFSPPAPTDAEGSTVVSNLPDGGYAVGLSGHPETSAQNVSLSGAGEVRVTLQVP